MRKNKYCNIGIKEETFKRFKSFCQSERHFMTGLLEKIIEDFLKKNEKNNLIKKNC